MLTRDDQEFFLGRMAKVTELLKPFVSSQYMSSYSKNHYSANIQLLRSTDLLSSNSLKCDVENIEVLAQKYVRQINAVRHFENYIPSSVYSIVEQSGVELPSLKKHSIQGVIARLQSTEWWKTQLYKVHVRRLEESAIKLGKVHAKSDKYISQESIKLYRQRQKRNRLMLEKMFAVNTETGEYFSLSDASKKSVSNPAIRRFEMMNRISGMDEKSVLDDHEAVFYTLTAPSRQHAFNYKTGTINPLYDGDTPRETHQDLCKKWSLVRAAANDQGINYSGLRVVEPHHDSTPHWHMLIFVKKHDIPTMTELFRKYFLHNDSPNEKGAQLRRVTLELIDRKRGSAVGYVAKYISKNIDGYGLDDVEVSDSDRVVAWSSLWGIRQFQFFGGPPVTVWRQMRALKEDVVSETFKQLHELCVGSDWVGYMSFADKNEVGCTYETLPKAGVYGDDVKKIKGVELNEEELVTTGDEYVFEFFDSSTDETLVYKF